MCKVINGSESIEYYLFGFLDRASNRMIEMVLTNFSNETGSGQGFMNFSFYDDFDESEPQHNLFNENEVYMEIYFPGQDKQTTAIIPYSSFYKNLEKVVYRVLEEKFEEYDETKIIELLKEVEETLVYRR